MADGALGHVQFGRRLAETEVAGGDLEGPQGSDWRQAIGHVHPYMNNYSCIV